jgi:NTE family protein
MSLAPNDRPARVDRGAVLVDLALQGGGAHGAFTWGVRTRFLEEDWLRIEGISGTSAGTMNAAVLADGHAAGGRQGAQTALRDFWRRVSDAALLSPFRRKESTCYSGSNPSRSCLAILSTGGKGLRILRFRRQ